MVDPVRIRSAWLKVGYIAVWLLLARIVPIQLISADVSFVVIAFLATALDVGAIILGARIFRSRNEDPVPPRPWWQLTGRPRAGFVIGGLIIASGVVNGVSAVTNPDTVNWATFALGSTVNLIIAAACLRSSVLLRKHARA